MFFSINSSKVYCKFSLFAGVLSSISGINSSKVYCKLASITISTLVTVVLIVAKCIVNGEDPGCRCWATAVLIVAKCIVNMKKGKKFFQCFKY